MVTKFVNRHFHLLKASPCPYLIPLLRVVFPPTSIWFSMCAWVLLQQPWRQVGVLLREARPQIQIVSSSTFCCLTHDQFDRNQLDVLNLHWFYVKQPTSVSDYVTHFTDLVDQLAAYSQVQRPFTATHILAALALSSKPLFITQLVHTEASVPRPP